MGNVDVTGLSLVTAQPAAAHHHLALTWVLCHIALSTVSAAFVAALPCHQTGTAVRRTLPSHRAPATGKGHACDEGRPLDWRALGAAAHLRLIASHHYYCMARRRNTPATKHQPHSLIEGSGLTLPPHASAFWRVIPILGFLLLTHRISFRLSNHHLSYRYHHRYSFTT